MQTLGVFDVCVIDSVHVGNHKANLERGSLFFKENDGNDIGNEIFLKTVTPSRKCTALYLGGDL